MISGGPVPRVEINWRSTCVRITRGALLSWPSVPRGREPFTGGLVLVKFLFVLFNFKEKQLAMHVPYNVCKIVIDSKFLLRK